jgi:hypothetical protein
MANVEFNIDSFFVDRGGGQRYALYKNKYSYLNYYIYRGVTMTTFKKEGVPRRYLKCWKFRVCIIFQHLCINGV